MSKLQMYPDKITKCYMEFRKDFEDLYNVYNKENEQLGYLKYERVGRFMHWCWYQHRDIRMCPGCLESIREIQKSLINRRNKKRSRS
jgi:hypothetical protein